MSISIPTEELLEILNQLEILEQRLESIELTQNSLIDDVDKMKVAIDANTDKSFLQRLFNKL